MDDEPTGDDIIAKFRECATMEQLEVAARCCAADVSALKQVQDGMFYEWVRQAYIYYRAQLRGY